MNKTDVTTMRTLNIKMVEEFANEVSARMVGFLRTYMFVDAQLSLVIPILARHVDFQDDIYRCAGLYHTVSHHHYPDSMK